MRTSKWSKEDELIVLKIVNDESLTNKEKATELKRLYPNNSVTSLANVLGLHRRTIHRYLLH